MALGQVGEVTQSEAQNLADEIVTNEMDQITAPLLAAGRALSYADDGFEVVRHYVSGRLDQIEPDRWLVRVDAGNAENRLHRSPRVTVTPRTGRSTY